MYKKYNHKIEGVSTDIVYMLSPRGVIYRSRVRIKKEAAELQLSNRDLALLIDFKPGTSSASERKVEEPDSDWVCDEHCPPGWRRKRYSYKSGLSKKIEQVFHYLTPENTVVRGKKQVYDYLKKTGTFNPDDFSRFHFNTPQKSKVVKDRLYMRKNKLNWGPWDRCAELSDGWMSRECSYNNQKKVQYRAPSGKKFQSRVLALKYLKAECAGSLEPEVELSFKSRRRRNVGPGDNLISLEPRLVTEDEASKGPVWEEWREDEIPCLLGWQFSIGRQSTKKMIRYKSPGGEIFGSRGSLLRHLRDNKLKSRDQLAILKKQLKTYQGLPFADLLKNDKFIKNFDPDTNYLEFLKVRYENDSHAGIEEETDPNLPPGWRKKNINGVEYFKDPTGHHVFNSRKLVVDHLRRNDELSREQIQQILNESESESELTDSEEERQTSVPGPMVTYDNNNRFHFVEC